jgi:hypothetical protein
MSAATEEIKAYLLKSASGGGKYGDSLGAVAKRYRRA